MKIKDILEKYDSELQKYANNAIPLFHQYMENESLPYNKFLDKLFQFYLFCSYLVDLKYFPEDNENEPIRILYAKACKTYYGIVTNLRQGLSSEAIILLRTLFENLLTVEILLQKDSSERLKLYSDYKYVERWKSLQANKKLLAKGLITEDRLHKTFDENRIKVVETKYNEVKENYHPKAPYHWAWKVFKDKLKNRNPSIYFISKELGYETDYVKLYSTFSIAAHGSPLIENLVTDSKSNTITLSPIFTDQIVSIGCLAIDKIAKIVNKIAKKYLEPEIFREINIYIEKYVGDVIIES